MEPWSRVHLGTVITINKWSDTHVFSTGGGGHVGPQGGYVSAPQVNSHIKQRAEVFSRGNDGQEDNFDLGFSNISFREGSKIFIVWGSELGQEKGQFLYAENLDTNEIYSDKSPLTTAGFGLFNGLFTGLCIFIMAYFALVASKQQHIGESEAISLLLIPCLIGICVWIARGVPKSRLFRKAAISKREDFVAGIVNNAAKQGINLTAKNLNLMTFVRT